jgi:polyhydroxyalkanoate synthase
MCNMKAQSRERGPHPLPAFLDLLVQQSAGDMERLRAMLTGLARYQKAPVPPAADWPAPLVQIGATSVRWLAGPERGPPVLLLPSIINGPEVLDHGPRHSLAQALGDTGARVLLLDWGDLSGERRLGLAGLVSRRVAPLVERLGRPVAVVGYCLGGTLGLGLAAAFPALVSRLALIATPWRFAGYPPEARAAARAAFAMLEPAGRALGAVPMALLNPLFWQIDAAGVAAKYARLGQSLPATDTLAAFAALEDWAGSGPPVPLPAVRDLFVDAIARDRLGRGRWRVAGTAVRPDRLRLPLLDIRGTADRLVPEATAPEVPGMAQLRLATGHVGMIVGRQRPAMLQALSTFLESD